MTPNLFSDENLDRLWIDACGQLRADGVDVDALIERAARNIDAGLRGELKSTPEDEAEWIRQFNETPLYL